MVLGEVCDHEVMCPLHGARFDLRTGRHLSLPAVRPVSRYEVKVDQGKVWVKAIEAEPTGSRTLTVLKSPAFSVKYQPHTSNLVFGCQDGSLQAVQVGNNGENWLPVINGRHLSAINALAFSPDASKLASASFDWTIRFSVFPFTEENPVTINSHDFWIYDLIFTPDGNKIISCSADKTIRIFSASEAQMVHKVFPIIQRNMTLAEWKKLVGEDVPYQKTINSLP